MQEGILQIRLERVKVHQCTLCDKVFISSECLEQHSEWHEFKAYLDRPGVWEHFISSHVKLDLVNIYQCNTCTNAFLNVYQFKEHLSNHNDKKKKTIKPESNDIDETNNNDLIKPHKCEECGLRFVALSTLEAHSVIHEPMPYICHCGIGYYKKGDLNSHQRLVHPTKLTWKPQTKYTGPKVKSEFAIEPELDQETAPRIGPKLKAELVVKKKKPKTKRNLNKENIKREKGDRKTQCDYCQKIFKNHHYLKKHLRIHTGEKPYECKKCPMSFTQWGALQRHTEMHENLRQYKCSYCDKRFNSKSFVKRHEIIHTNERPYKCSFEACGKGFSDPSALSRHLRVHTDDRRYKCEYCHLAFTDYSGYLAHKNRKHLYKKVPCKLCLKYFASVSNLNVHMRIQHKLCKPEYKDRYFECDYCGKRFDMKQYLNAHIQMSHIHREKKYKCDFCPKLFTHPLYCDNHMKVEHLKRYAFECDYCGELYTKKLALLKHIKTNHISITKHECSYCHKLLDSEKILLKHLSKHFYNKCDKCKSRFQSPVQLKVHNCRYCNKCGSYFKNVKVLEHHNSRNRCLKIRNRNVQLLAQDIKNDEPSFNGTEIESNQYQASVDQYTSSIEPTNESREAIKNGPMRDFTQLVPAI